MITDPVAVQQIRDSWETVRESKNQAGLTITKAFLSGLPAGAGPQELFWGLILIFAFSVLEEALLELKDQGVFKSKGNKLQCLMNASVASLTWIDFALVDEGRGRRNDVAHRRLQLPVSECQRFIDGIEAELRGWAILS